MNTILFLSCILMEMICGLCNRRFYSNALRAQCYICRSHPRISSPGVVVGLYSKGLSYKDVAVELGISKTLVEIYIRNFGIPRPMGPHPIFPKVFLDLDWFDGWLLGDGSLRIPRGSKNCSMSHGSSKESYTQYVKSNWLRMGFTASPVLFSVRKFPMCESYSVTSRAHPSLTDQYSRWYTNSKKLIPLDVRVSPVSVREWYLGDGSLAEGKFPILVMGGVFKSEVDRMFQKLCAVFGEGITKQECHSSRVTKSGDHLRPYWRFLFTKRVASAFFSYIGPCPLSCYLYKWPCVR